MFRFESFIAVPLRGLPPLAIETELLLECDGKRARYRVVWIGPKDSSYEGHVGLECVDPNPSIFGIDPAVHGHFYDGY